MTTLMPPAMRGLAATAAQACVLAIVLLTGTGSALAQEVTGDAAAGAGKAATCTACHGLNGNSVNPEWPVLAGQNAAYLRDQIERFRGGKRVNPLMLPMVQNLTDQDVADLAAFFSTQTPTGHEADPSYWKAGEKLYRGGDVKRDIPACLACHGPVARGNPAAGYPALQAQHSVYTVTQLNNYAGDLRYARDEQGRSQAGPNAHMMNTIASRLSQEDRRNLASYIQGIR
jgi:cytochrome c553